MKKTTGMFFSSHWKHSTDTPMKKIIITFSLLLCCSYFVQAQTGGSPVGNSGTGDGAKAYSNGYIPNANVEKQFNTTDSTHHADTTYREQQWNGTSAKRDSTQKKTSSKKNMQTTHKTTTTKKTTVSTSSKNK